MSLWDRVLNRIFKCRMRKQRGGVCPKCKGQTPIKGSYPPLAPCLKRPPMPERRGR